MPAERRRAQRGCEPCAGRRRRTVGAAAARRRGGRRRAATRRRRDGTTGAGDRARRAPAQLATGVGGPAGRRARHESAARERRPGRPRAQTATSRTAAAGAWHSPPRPAGGGSGRLRTSLRPRHRTRSTGVEFDVTIEIPKGQRNKYEVDHETGRIRLDRHAVHLDALPRRLRLRRGHARRGRRPAGRARPARGADVPRLPDQGPGDRHVPHARRGRRRRQGAVRAGRRPAPGAPAATSTTSPSSTGWRSSTSSRSTRTSSPASRVEGAHWAAGTRPSSASPRPCTGPRTPA